MRPIFAIFLLFLASSAAAEPQTAFRPQMPSMQNLLRASGMIFAGTVVQVQRLHPGTVQITLRVEEPIRGVRRWQTVQISEWAGLWTSGDRYIKGQHVMLFLYPKSKLGLTSPVGGGAGRYSFNSAGQVLVPAPLGGTRPVPLKTFKAQIRRVVGE